MKGGTGDSGEVTGFREMGGQLPLDEIEGTLGGCFLPATADLGGEGFEMSLKGNACEDTVLLLVRGGIFGFDGDDKAAVGERGIAAGERHSIDDDLIIFGGGGHNETTRAHAERMDAAITDFRGNPIAGGGEEMGSLGVWADVVLKGIDEVLGVFDANTDCEGLGFEEEPGIDHHGVDVARAVTGGENDAFGLKFTPVGYGDPSDGFAIFGA